MSNHQALWTKVDQYVEEKLIPSDEALDTALAANREAGLPAIDVSPAQGKLLQVLAIMNRARRILEIGTLGGYSTIWLAGALPAGGKLVTLEYEAHHASVAKRNIERAGLADRVEIRVGLALDQLGALAEEEAEPFDLIFIDADKPNNPHYLDWALRFSRPGTVIIGDNVIRNGDMIDANNEDVRVIGTRQFFDKLASEPRMTCTAIQTVGSKGYDGFMIGIVDK
ncbi:O-methyltransferase [Paenibacillus sp. NPDC057967]|uniref:O-methyltransferase n=1 Tax=Paenibacillus sp. NPDC057967 TaxID=3346293 RepID=UPI0036DEC8B5